ncbi:phospholipase A2 A2-actitoxin-Cgg2a-like [Orbicella faveolata]|uniref:phospholipase A2 A2-actitoxin-Cgg2a-like n=1 Tax=Orbicella faveolata TaxID=48498 RepID=UPI0009E1973B|nr:phospholipase A2 A2-actitoxin-Cgg2a-like [Orbicella faveolata]
MEFTDWLYPLFVIYYAGRFQKPMKRNLGQFGAMVLCETKRNPLHYIGYGCWCGFGGKGTPVDEIDQCCYIHDRCYDNITEKGTCPFEIGVYANVYKRKDCTRCAEISIFGNSRCEKELCECDAAAARCFKKYDSKFQDRYKNYDKSSC